MQTSSEYIETLSKPRKIRIDGAELTHPNQHKALNLSYLANIRFYDLPKELGEAKSLKLSKRARHPFFTAARKKQDIIDASTELNYSQSHFHGLYTRIPDYKGSFITCLESNQEAYGEYQSNAIKLHESISRDVPAITHAFVAPPNFLSGDLQANRGLKVVSKDSSGIVVRGIKSVSTGATSAEMLYVRDSRSVQGNKETLNGLSFMCPIWAEGLVLVCSQSITNDNTFKNASSFPISSYLDENDTILLFNDVFIPNEYILCAEELTTNRWKNQHHGFIERARMHGVIRVLNKLDLIKGFLVLAAPRMKPGAQDTKDILAQTELAITTLRALHRNMILQPEKIESQEYLPNRSAAATAYILAPTLIGQIKDVLMKGFAGSLISMPSSPNDITENEIDTLTSGLGNNEHLEKSILYTRSVKELLLSDFGTRQELFESNYLGNSRLAMNDLFEIVRDSFDNATLVNQALSILKH